tara:strand:+ start:151 stop:747 length:597 start_codon:yes stop_codon:yes gene_type:complete
MKRLLALLLLLGIVACTKEPTQLEKCIAVNSKSIIEMQNDNKNYPKPVLLSSIVNIEKFDNDYLQEIYRHVLKNSNELKVYLADDLVNLEAYEREAFDGSYEEFEIIKLADIDPNNMNFFGAKLINDLFTSNKEFNNDLEYYKTMEQLHAYEINILTTNIIYNNKYIDYHLNLEEIINKIKTAAESEAIKVCNSQGIY